MLNKSESDPIRHYHQVDEDDPRRKHMRSGENGTTYYADSLATVAQRELSKVFDLEWEIDNCTQQNNNLRNLISKWFVENTKTVCSPANLPGTQDKDIFLRREAEECLPVITEQVVQVA